MAMTDKRQYTLAQQAAARQILNINLTDQEADQIRRVDQRERILNKYGIAVNDPRVSAFRQRANDYSNTAFAVRVTQPGQNRTDITIPGVGTFQKQDPRRKTTNTRYTGSKGGVPQTTRASEDKENAPAAKRRADLQSRFRTEQYNARVRKQKDLKQRLADQKAAAMTTSVKNLRTGLGEAFSDAYRKASQTKPSTKKAPVEVTKYKPTTPSGFERRITAQAKRQRSLNNYIEKLENNIEQTLSTSKLGGKSTAKQVTRKILAKIVSGPIAAGGGTIAALEKAALAVEGIARTASRKSTIAELKSAGKKTPGAVLQSYDYKTTDGLANIFLTLAAPAIPASAAALRAGSSSTAASTVASAARSTKGIRTSTTTSTPGRTSLTFAKTPKAATVAEFNLPVPKFVETLATKARATKVAVSKTLAERQAPKAIAKANKADAQAISIRKALIKEVQANKAKRLNDISKSNLPDAQRSALARFAKREADAQIKDLLARDELSFLDRGKGSIDVKIPTPKILDRLATKARATKVAVSKVLADRRVPGLLRKEAKLQAKVAKQTESKVQAIIKETRANLNKIKKYNIANSQRRALNIKQLNDSYAKIAKLVGDKVAARKLNYKPLSNKKGNYFYDRVRSKIKGVGKQKPKVTTKKPTTTKEIVREQASNSGGEQTTVLQTIQRPVTRPAARARALRSGRLGRAATFVLGAASIAQGVQVKSRIANNTLPRQDQRPEQDQRPGQDIIPEQGIKPKTEQEADQQPKTKPEESLDTRSKSTSDIVEKIALGTGAAILTAAAASSLFRGSSAQKTETITETAKGRMKLPGLKFGMSALAGKYGGSLIAPGSTTYNPSLRAVILRIIKRGIAPTAKGSGSGTRAIYVK